MITKKARTYPEQDTLRRHEADFQIRQAFFIKNYANIITIYYNIVNCELSSSVDKA